MDANRLTALTDGVVAIIVTIMVLEMRPPHAPTLAALAERCVDDLGPRLAALWT